MKTLSNNKKKPPLKLRLKRKLRLKPKLKLELRQKIELKHGNRLVRERCKK